MQRIRSEVSHHNRFPQLLQGLIPKRGSTLNSLHFVACSILHRPNEMAVQVHSAEQISPRKLSSVRSARLSEKKDLSAWTGRWNFRVRTETQKCRKGRHDTMLRYRDEVEVGTVSISVPILSPTGELFAALTVAGPSVRLTQGIIRAKFSEVFKAARDIAAIYRDGRGSNQTRRLRPISKSEKYIRRDQRRS